MRYRKKPIVIEAFQMTKERRISNSEWPQWLHMAWNKAPGEVGSVFPSNYHRSDGKDKLAIQTMEGRMTVEWNSWVIRGVNGELYACDPEIFEKTYEKVD